MDAISWLSVISGITGIAGFIFGIWTWQRAEARMKEFATAMQALHDIADAAAWESEIVGSGDSTARLAQLEKALGQLLAMRTLSARFLANNDKKGVATERDPYIHRKVLWSNPMIQALEASSGVRTIWLATPDLEPDVSHSGTGTMVKNNLKAGKNYVYFYPSSTPLIEARLQQLRRNIGADERRLGRHVSLVQVPDWSEIGFLQTNGNTILFFDGVPSLGPSRALQEVVLNKIDQRGVLWQECGPEEASVIFSALQELMPPAAN